MVSNTAFEQAVLDALARIEVRLSRVEADVASLKADVASLKTDVASLKTEMSSTKTDVTSLKSEVATLNVRVERLERETFHHYTSLTKDVQQVNRNVEFFALTTDTRLSALETQVTNIAGTVAQQGRRLTAVEHRLTAIEARLPAGPLS
jgi:chromosome segregation ATPase